MKKYEVHRVKERFTPNSTEKLRKSVEELLNKKGSAGYKPIKIDFELQDNSGYIYCFIVFEI